MDVAELGVAPFTPPEDIAGAKEGGAGMEDGGGDTWICGDESSVSPGEMTREEKR